MLSRKLNELIYLNILLWQIFIKLDFFKTSFSSVDFEFIFFIWLHKNLKQKKSMKLCESWEAIRLKNNFPI